jgi:hypothetical protein
MAFASLGEFVGNNGIHHITTEGCDTIAGAKNVDSI